MKPCPACSPATRFQCDVCDGAGEVPETNVHTRFEAIGEHSSDGPPNEAMETIHEMMMAAHDHRLTLCEGPNPFDPTKTAHLIFAIHPDDVAKFRSNQPARKAPLAVLIGQEEVMQMVARDRAGRKQP